MKKISLLLFVCSLFVGAAFSQSNRTTQWAELREVKNQFNDFYQYTKGNNKLSQYLENSAMLYQASKMLHEATVPDEYILEETKKNVDYLTMKCNELNAQVAGRAVNSKIKALLDEVGALITKIEVDCKRVKK